MDIEQVLKQAKHGCNKSVNLIMAQYEPLIKSVSSKYYSNLHDYDDFMQLARMGIWMAIQTYPLRKYYVQKIGNALTFRLDENYKPPHHFIAWMKKSIQHYFAREIRKENQLCRMTNKLAICDDEAVANIPDCGRNIDQVYDKLLSTTKKKLEGDEMICFQSVVDRKTFSETVSEVKKVYKHFTGDDVKIEHSQMLTKVRFEVLNFA